MCHSIRDTKSPVVGIGVSVYSQIKPQSEKRKKNNLPLAWLPLRMSFPVF
jgi:hypothetical protein